MTFVNGSEFIPNLILIDIEAQKYAYTEEVLKRLSAYDLECIVVDTEEHAKQILKEKKKKNHLYLTVNRGAFIRKKTFGQDCTSFEEAYCLDHISGCHFACVYCYLHSYLKDDPFVRLYVNLEDMFKELKTLASEKGSLFISTGELSDSLLFDKVSGLTEKMYYFLKDHPHIEMEFRSKSAYTEFVSQVKPLDHMYLTWTLSPQTVVDRYELKTASLQQRIEAIKTCQKQGISVGVIVDPMIHYDGWEKDYVEMIDQLAAQVNLQEVRRLFVGSFRYMKGMDKDILQKFPKTDLFSGEFVLARDSKYRYFKPIREQMYRTVKERLDLYHKPMSLSMEFPETWKKIVGKS